VRQGPWKLILPDRKVFYTYVKDRGSNEIELYNLETDLGETKNVARDNPAVVERLTKFARSFQWPEKLFDPGIALSGTNVAPKKSAKKAP
jgi:hypothetical protein